MRITGRQVDGLIVCVLMTAAVCLFSLYSASITHQDARIAHGDPRDGPVVVRLSGDLSRRGIYYLPDDTTLLNLLTFAGIERHDRFDKNILGLGLIAGQTVTVGANGSLTLGQMDAAERLALDLPIDLNRATRDELMLIPGIGEATAERIVEFRNTSGLFRKVADLKKVPGIKEKKLKQWERNFYLPPF
ncbi:MAG: helix-hairpin-helix domain-containing protein [Pseudomonadota bacterium]